jgi:vacuolar-type H+-ATPase subunit F/Vma7
MARLVVLASLDLADGFRLAGAPTIGIGADDATVVLRRVAAEPGVGVVFVTDDLWDRLEERTRDALERLGRPLVVPVPIGELAEAGGRRAVIEEMLERAIGFRTDLVGAAGRGAAGRAGVP